MSRQLSRAVLLPALLLAGLLLVDPLSAQPATQAVDPAMVRARDWLQTIDRGEFERAWKDADASWQKKDLERFTKDVSRNRPEAPVTVACRAGLYVELVDRPPGSMAYFDTRFSNGKRVTERVTLYYGEQDVLHAAAYKIDPPQKGKGGCGG